MQREAGIMEREGKMRNKGRKHMSSSPTRETSRLPTLAPRPWGRRKTGMMMMRRRRRTARILQELRTRLVRQEIRLMTRMRMMMMEQQKLSTVISGGMERTKLSFLRAKLKELVLWRTEMAQLRIKSRSNSSRARFQTRRSMAWVESLMVNLQLSVHSMPQRQPKSLP
jgi:hypothetical protein